MISSRLKSSQHTKIILEWNCLLQEIKKCKHKISPALSILYLDFWIRKLCKCTVTKTLCITLCWDQVLITETVWGQLYLCLWEIYRLAFWSHGCLLVPKMKKKQQKKKTTKNYTLLQKKWTVFLSILMVPSVTDPDNWSVWSCRLLSSNSHRTYVKLWHGSLAVFHDHLTNSLWSLVIGQGQWPRDTRGIGCLFLLVKSVCLFWDITCQNVAVFSHPIAYNTTSALIVLSHNDRGVRALSI